MSPRKIAVKVLVQARIRPDARKQLERQAAKAGLRFCTYLAQELEAIAMRGKPVGKLVAATDSKGSIKPLDDVRPGDTLVVEIDPS